MANSYLNRTPSSTGNRKTFTISMWMKRSKIDNNQKVFTAGTAGTESGLQFYDGSTENTLRFYEYSSSSDQFVIAPNRLLRDTNAWYHIVIAVDTTQATASNRIKYYVNGVQETSFATATYPSQNYDTLFNLSGTVNTVGFLSGHSAYFDGYMSHVALVDGQQLAPTVFGETDSTSGIWKFKSPSGVTWGTNGFHLKFENSANLGLDSSGQTNNFTVNGNLKQALDTPSNVYATMNPLDNYYQSSTFSEGSNTIEHGQTPWTYNTSTLKIPEATKFYCEGKVITMNQNTCGIASDVTTGNGNSSTSLGNITGGVAFRGNQGDIQKEGSTVSGTWATFTTNDIIQIACDTVNNKLYFGKNGTWLNSGDPTSGASGTGAISITDNTDYFFAFGDNTSGARGKWSINFGNGFFGTTAIASAGSNGNGSLFEYDVPSGYYALNTKNINTYG